jgi:hypothetical protein
LDLFSEVNHTEIGDHKIVGKSDQELMELAEHMAKEEVAKGPHGGHLKEIAHKHFASFNARLEQMRQKNIELLNIRAQQDHSTVTEYNFL